MKTPSIWIRRGGTDPELRSTFSNDTEVSFITFYKANSATAVDADWSVVGAAVAKPSPVTLYWVYKTDTGQGFVDTVYYRARQSGGLWGSYASPWSNVINNQEETFLFDLREKEGLLRHIQFQVDTQNAEKGMTWMEAMEIMVAEHENLRAFLRTYFYSDDVDLIWASPPPDLVRFVTAKVALEIISQSDLSTTDKKTRKEEAQLAMDRILDSMFRNQAIRLSNGEVKEFQGTRVRAI